VFVSCDERGEMKEVKPGESNVKMQVNSISGMLFVKVTECKSGKVESKKILIKQ